MSSTTSTISGNLKTKTIPSATPVVQLMAGQPLPCTVYLTSAAAGRLIEFSVDGGTTYYNATYDYTSATQVVVKVQGSITHLRFTGTTNDTYGVL